VPSKSHEGRLSTSRAPPPLGHMRQHRECPVAQGTRLTTGSGAERTCGERGKPSSQRDECVHEFTRIDGRADSPSRPDREILRIIGSGGVRVALL
jgi:hypothetical protein